jgi:hypothetical protein
MKQITWTDAATAAAALEQGEREETVVVRDGRAVALVVPFDDDDFQWYLRERKPEFIDSIQRARADVAAGRAVTHEELKRQLGEE